MGEISSRATGPVLEALARRGVATADLVAGTGISIDGLRPGGRISWDEWIDLLEYAERLGGADILEQAGMGIHEISWNRILAGIGRIAWTEAQFWKLVTRRVAPAIYPAMSFSFDSLDDGRFRIRGDVREGYRGSMALMRFFAGMIRGSTRLLGHDENAQVEFQFNARHTTVDVTPLPRTGRFGPALRRLAGFLLGGSAVKELERQHRELQRSHTQLEESQARLRAITQSGFDMIAELDQAGRFVYVSPNFRTILGFEPEDLLDTDALALIHPDERDLVLAKLEIVLREDKSEQVTLRYRDHLGNYRWVDAAATPFRSAGGELRASVVARDVNDARLAAEHLQQSQKMEAVGRLAGGIAHDFNNLLTVITGYGELLQERFAIDDPDRKTAAEILAAADRASILTRQLLTLGRSQPAEIGVLDICQVISGLVPMAESLLGEDIQLDLEIPTVQHAVRADRSQLEQIVVNLVVNARDAMHACGSCCIAIRAVGSADDGPRVQLLVRDTGVGMDAETKSRAFEPFFSTKGPQDGTGLGLAIVYAIVEQSGGTVEIESVPNSGTQVTIELPSADPADLVPLETSTEPARGGHETVLLVEDQPALLSMAARILRERGYAVIEAADAAEALSQSTEFGGSIDLLTTDVVMPGMSGPELWLNLSKQIPGLRVLFLSGYIGAEAEQHSVLAKENFLAKPFTGERLAKAVRSSLDAPSASL